MVTRVVHDKLKSSRLNQRLENRLKSEIQLYLNHTIIPALRSRKTVNPLSFDNIITSYSTAFYRLGANYVSKVANRELLSSEQDHETSYNLVKYFTETFWKKIEGLSSIQRVQPNLRPSQVVSMEKERLSSEMSTLVAWKSYNSGVKSKGIELQNDLKSVKRNGLIGMKRRVYSKDFTKIYSQRIITDRQPNLERTSQEIDLEGMLTGEEAEAVTSFVFVTQQDELVCELCRGFEFDSWALADPDIPVLPDDTHPNCRCILMLAETQEETALRISKKELLELGLTGTEIGMLGADVVGLITGAELRDHFEEILEQRRKKEKKKLLAKKKK